MAADGKLLVAGGSFNGAHEISNGTESDYTLLLYSSPGELQGIRRLTTTARGGDIPAALAVDGLGGIVITGQSWSGSTADIVTVKFSR